MSLLPVDPCDTCRRHHASDGFCEDDEDVGAMPRHESGPEAAHDRAVRKAREQLRVDRYFGDADGVARALARLAELGVDEAGDALPVREQSWRAEDGL